MLRQCKKCNELFNATAKTSRICPLCRKTSGGRVENKYLLNKYTIDPEKLMILKKKLDKMSYAEAIG